MDDLLLFTPSKKSSLTHITKSIAEPVTIRIKRLLELISSYSFNLYCIKGKDMVLSEFLSRQSNNDSNPHEGYCIIIIIIIINLLI